MCILSMKYSHKSGSVWITEDFIWIINQLNSYQMLIEISNAIMALLLVIIMFKEGKKFSLFTSIMCIILGTAALVLQIIYLTT